MDIGNYLRQHHQIKEVIRLLKNSHDFENNAKNTAILINKLSGQLKIHLTTEDKYLYPFLKQSDNPVLSALGEKFEKEMVGISDKFLNFKKKYNVENSIKQDLANFKIELSDVLGIIENRLDREEKEFYPQLQKS